MSSPKPTERNPLFAGSISGAFRGIPWRTAGEKEIARAMIGCARVIVDPNAKLALYHVPGPTVQHAGEILIFHLGKDGL